jgi:Tfp pilus assembly protein PilZ
MNAPRLLEKRAAQRIMVALTAHCRIGNRYARNPVGDLSIAGLFLQTREVVKQGTPVRVAIALPFSDGPRFCTLAGAVARVEHDRKGVLRGVGVSFAEEQIANVDRENLIGFIAAS